MSNLVPLRRVMNIRSWVYFGPDYGHIGSFWWLNSNQAGIKIQISLCSDESHAGSLLVLCRYFGRWGMSTATPRPPVFSTHVLSRKATQ